MPSYAQVARAAIPADPLAIVTIPEGMTGHLVDVRVVNPTATPTTLNVTLGGLSDIQPLAQGVSVGANATLVLVSAGSTLFMRDGDVLNLYTPGVAERLVAHVSYILNSAAPLVLPPPTRFNNALIGDGAPSIDADFVGQVYIDQSTTPRRPYVSISVGDGAADWIRLATV